MSLFLEGTHRRGFIGRMLGGAAALTVGGWSAAQGEPPAEGEAWLTKIKGKHRQVVDCVSANDGFGVAFGLNYIDTTKEALKLADKDFTSVIVYRHFAMPLMANDDVWKRYKLGEFMNIKDPKTGAPAERNIFHDSIFGRPNLTYEQTITTRPVIMTACNLALTVVSGMAAEKAGLKADTAAAEWKSNLLPGVYLVPSGVYAVARAQENGCTYCFGG